MKFCLLQFTKKRPGDEKGWGMKIAVKDIGKMIKSDIVNKIAYMYMTIPIIIFVLFWLEWYIVLPMIILLLFCVYKIWKHEETENFSNEVFKEKKKCIIILLILFFWVAISGIGKLAYQNEDHIWRNTMFESLCQYRWPVVRDILQDGVWVERGFSYYIGFWLPAAAVGKVFGVEVGYFVQVIWALIGVFLLYYKICELFKKVLIWPLFIFIFFSGMDILGCYLFGMDIFEFSSTLHLEVWCSQLQYSSFTTQLFWVFNQAIPAWLATMMILSTKNNKNIVFIYATTLLHCTLPAIGMLPILFCKILKTKYGKNKQFHIEWWKCLCRDVVTFENITGILIVILSMLYLARDASIEKFTLFSFQNGGWLLYILFLLMEIGGLAIVSYWANKTNMWYYVCLVWLIICPLPQVYGENNFCMRACIPALLILYLCVIKAILYYKRNSMKIHLASLTIVLLIGAVTPVHEILRSFWGARTAYWSEEKTVAAESLTIEDVLTNDYESVNVSESFFFQYLAQKKE